MGKSTTFLHRLPGRHTNRAVYKVVLCNGRSERVCVTTICALPSLHGTKEGAHEWCAHRNEGCGNEEGKKGAPMCHPICVPQSVHMWTGELREKWEEGGGAHQW